VTVVAVPFAATKHVLLDVIRIITALLDLNVMPPQIHANLVLSLANLILIVLQELFAKMDFANLDVRKTLIVLPKLFAKITTACLVVAKPLTALME